MTGSVQLRDSVPAAISTTTTTADALKDDAVAATREHVLDFSNGYYGDAKCAEIVAQARRAPFPTALDLRGNRFEAAGAAALAELLRAPHNVVSMSLEWNNVGLLDQGVEALASALSGDARLLALDLRNNNVGPEGAKALAKALTRNRTLRRLDLRWNDVGNAGALAFREALQSNYTLVALELVGNNSNLKHVEEIEKLLARNRAFQEQQPLVQPPAVHHEATQSDPPQETPDKHKAKHTDDQLLLQVLAEKEAFECELVLARKEAQRMSERAEESEMQLKMARKESESLKEERNRHQQREADAKRESHELKMQLDELENKRKMEFEEYRGSRTALERELGVMRDKMAHAEALHSKSLEQKTKQIAQLEDHKYSQDSELHKLALSIRALEDESEKLRKQLLDAQKEFEKREEKQSSSYHSNTVALQRQHELEMRSLTSQLSHMTLQYEESHSSALALKEKLESLQTSALQTKISHEREITEMKKQWELEIQERIQRSVVSIEVQVDEMKKGREHLEREVERHMEMILRLRQESVSLQQSSDDKQRGLREQLEKQYKEVQEKEDLLAAAVKENAKCAEKIESHARRLEEQDAKLARTKANYEDRIREMTEAAKLQYQEAKDALKQKADVIAMLGSCQLRLEREIDKQTREHESRMDRFADSVAEFVQTQIVAERERRKKRGAGIDGDNSAPDSSSCTEAQTMADTMSETQS